MNDSPISAEFTSAFVNNTINKNIAELILNTVILKMLFLEQEQVCLGSRTCIWSTWSKWINDTKCVRFIERQGEVFWSSVHKYL